MLIMGIRVGMIGLSIEMLSRVSVDFFLLNNVLVNYFIIA